MRIIITCILTFILFFIISSSATTSLASSPVDLFFHLQATIASSFSAAKIIQVRNNHHDDAVLRYQAHNSSSSSSGIDLLSFLQLASQNEHIFDSPSKDDQKSSNFINFSSSLKRIISASPRHEIVSHFQNLITAAESETLYLKYLPSSSSSSLICSSSSSSNSPLSNMEDVLSFIHNVSMMTVLLRKRYQDVINMMSATATSIESVFLGRIQNVLFRELEQVKSVLLNSSLLRNVSLSTIENLFANLTSNKTSESDPVLLPAAIEDDHHQQRNNSSLFTSSSIVFNINHHFITNASFTIDETIRQKSVANFTEILSAMLLLAAPSTQQQQCNLFGFKKADEIGSRCTKCPVFNASPSATSHTFCFGGIERSCFSPTSSSSSQQIFFSAPFLPAGVVTLTDIDIFFLQNVVASSSSSSSSTVSAADSSKIIIDSTICRKFCRDPKLIIDRQSGKCVSAKIGFYPSADDPFEQIRCVFSMNHQENNNNRIEDYCFTSSGFRGMNNSCSFEKKFAEQRNLVSNDQRNEVVLNSLCLPSSINTDDDGQNTTTSSEFSDSNNFFFTIDVSATTMMNDLKYTSRKLFSLGVSIIINNSETPKFHQIVTLNFSEITFDNDNDNNEATTTTTTIGIHFNKFEREMKILTLVHNNNSLWRTIRIIDKIPIFPFCNELTSQNNQSSNISFIIPVIRYLPSSSSDDDENYNDDIEEKPSNFSSASTISFSNIKVTTNNRRYSIIKENYYQASYQHQQQRRDLDSSSTSSMSFKCSSPLISSQTDCTKFSTTSSSPTPMIVENIISSSSPSSSSSGKLLFVENSTILSWNVSFLTTVSPPSTTTTDNNNDGILSHLFSFFPDILASVEIRCSSSSLSPLSTTMITTFEQVTNNQNLGEVCFTSSLSPLSSTAATTSENGEERQEEKELIMMGYKSRLICPFTFRLKKIGVENISSSYSTSISCKLVVKSSTATTTTNNNNNNNNNNHVVTLPLHTAEIMSSLPEASVVFNRTSIRLPFPKKDLIKKVQHEIDLELEEIPTNQPQQQQQTEATTTTTMILIKEIKHFVSVTVDLSSSSLLNYFHQVDQVESTTSTTTNSSRGLIPQLGVVFSHHSSTVASTTLTYWRNRKQQQRENLFLDFDAGDDDSTRTSITTFPSLHQQSTTTTYISNNIPIPNQLLVNCGMLITSTANNNGTAIFQLPSPCVILIKIFIRIVVNSTNDDEVVATSEPRVVPVILSLTTTQIQDLFLKKTVLVDEASSSTSENELYFRFGTTVAVVLSALAFVAVLIVLWRVILRKVWLPKK